jgi:hypothetical protein
MDEREAMTRQPEEPPTRESHPFLRTLWTVAKYSLTLGMLGCAVPLLVAPGITLFMLDAPEPPFTIVGWATGFGGGAILGARRTGASWRRFPVAVVIGVLLSAPVSIVLTPWLTLPFEYALAMVGWS